MKQIAFVLILIFMLALNMLAGEPLLQKEVFFAAKLPLIVSDEGPEVPVLAASPAVKSKGKAFLLSLLLPGLGERYAGANNKAQIFMGAELSLWLGYSGFLTYRDWRKEEYQNYAAAHAAVDIAGKSETFFVNVGNYDDIDQYNAAKLRQRNLYDYYRDVETNYWRWDSAESRAEFEQIRLSAARADNRATFALGAIFANHLISAIDAVWSVHRHNRDLLSRVNWDLQLGDGVTRPRVSVSLQANL